MQNNKWRTINLCRNGQKWLTCFTESTTGPHSIQSMNRMICVFYIHPGCVAGRRVYISISAWQIATRESLDLETKIHDLHGASASRWTEAILCFKGFQNWGLERCNLDVWSQKDAKISPSKNPHPLIPRCFPFREEQQHRVWTISIERELGCQQSCYCLSGCVDLASPSSCVYWSFSSLSLPQSHSFNQHSQSSLYIFTRSDANVLSHWHIFIFTSANALGGLFQILLRAGYWGVIDVAAVLCLQGKAATLSGKSNGSVAWNGHRLPFYVATKC